jgi:predicted DNA-binding ribbon-helix-helix protein
MLEFGLLPSNCKTLTSSRFTNWAPRMKGSNDNRDGTVYFSGSQTVPASRTRNVRIGGARSSIRLEEAFWEALDEILYREDLTLDGLVTRISGRLPVRANLSSAVRVFIHSYFYALSHDRTPRLPPGAAWKAHKQGNRDSIQDPE